MARKRGVKRNQEEVFLSELGRHGSVRKACVVAGVSRSWVNEKKLDEDFAKAFADAIEDSIDRIEEAGVKGALSGDDKLIRYLLDARRYKKNVELNLGEVKPTINISIGGSN